MKTASLFKPTVLSFGFALVLSINATSVWGGVFPYFPIEYQTTFTTMLFYIVQLIALMLTYAVSMAITWSHSNAIQRVPVLASSIPLSAGSLMLVAAMYVRTAVIPLLVTGAVCVGVGTALYMMTWQLVFAARKSSEGDLALILGAGLSALLYFGILLIPAALTAYLIPLVLVPLAGLCLWIAVDQTNSNHPMFNDVPLEHKLVYRNALRESLPPALCAGALGFCMGAIHFAAMSHIDLANALSMLALLASVAVFLPLWKKRTLRFDLMMAYRVLFPIVAVGMLMLPFTGNVSTILGIAISYAAFTVMNMLVMMHCCQVARNSGISPVFMFAFFEAVIYLLQIVGYAVGSAASIGFLSDIDKLAPVAVSSLFVMLIASLANTGTRKLHTTRLEFLMLAPSKTGAKDSKGNRPSDENLSREMEVTQNVARQNAMHSNDELGASEAALIDRTSKRCQKIKETYGLSSREAEVMELVARGKTGAVIAEALFISENTVRTHQKRVYAKLGIHKKQELLAVVENTDAD